MLLDPFLTNLVLVDISNHTASNMTINLPFEILTAIFKEVDVCDIWHIRVVSSTFCAVATPIAFRILSVVPTIESAQNLGRLFDVPYIADHVREITFCDRDIYERRMTIKHDITSVINELTSSFSRLHQLPRLKTINLMFYKRYGYQRYGKNRPDGSSHALQSAVLSALASSFRVRAPDLTLLSLHNLRTSDISPLESPPFQTVLTTLQRFRLSPLFDPPDPFTLDDRWSHFWGTLRPPMLTPMQHPLTELILDSNAHVGTLAGLSFDWLHFPCLCSLSLSKLVFEPSIGAQNFILRHAATLARLELITCRLPANRATFFKPSPSSSRTFARDESSSRLGTWERVWDCFAAELTALVSLHVMENREEWNPDFQYRIHGLWMPGSRDTGSFARRNAADAAALRRLHITVNTRRRCAEE
ncbi:hypothetical protein EDB87DRAFT_1619807 [Lactarius vividus]|nr:hypothetical protein EDB87DRAFT_1619807 [Lactarius vividus]